MVEIIIIYFVYEPAIWAELGEDGLSMCWAAKVGMEENYLISVYWIQYGSY